MRRVAPRLLATLALTLLLTACPNGTEPLRTSIAFFEANVTSVERGATVTLSWQVDNPGSAPGVASCSITRRAENEPPGEPFEVACTSTLAEIPPAPSTSGYVRYQLSALKRPLDTVDPYLVSVITISLTSAPAVTGVSIDPSDASLPVGDTLQLTATVTAIGGASETVTWSSSDEGVVSVNSSGLVTAVAVGSATVTATSDFDASRIDSVTLSVRATTYATRAGGADTDRAWAVSALADGSAIVTGYFNGTATFGGTTLTSAGGDDIYVARINPNGSWAWATSAGGTHGDRGYGVSALADGGAIVAGYFEGTATFGNMTLTSPGPNADPRSDAFVARISADGTWVWAAQAGGPDVDAAWRVSALGDGSAIVVGEFEGTASFGATSLTSAGSGDVFVARINADGAWVWATRAGGTSGDIARAVSSLSDGSAIVTGEYAGTATFGGTTLVSAGGTDVFVARVNADGTWAWATRAGGASNDSAWGVSALSDGSAIVAGYFSGTATFGSATLTSAGSADVFVARIDANGTWAWATRAGGTSFDNAWGLSALSDGSVVVAGYFNGTATFGGTTLTSAGSGDVFVARVNANGTWAWATRAGGPGFDEALGGVATLGDGSAIVTGHFNGAATFGTTTLTSAGVGDVFVAKIDPLGAW